MNLYDVKMRELNQLIEGYEGVCIPVNEINQKWEDVGDNNLVLKSDMKYELGGNNKEAVSCIAFTSSKELVKEDEVWVYGPNLQDIKTDISYARIVFIKLKDHITGDTNEDYRLMRNIEYTRYKVSPAGYMSRISVSKNHEPVRVSNEAITRGLDFEKVGKLFTEAYHKYKEVEAVKIMFITIPEFPYDRLKIFNEQLEKIMDSIDHIFKDFSMDCSTCGFKKVCDEVDGMKELHKSQIKKSK